MDRRIRLSLAILLGTVISACGAPHATEPTAAPSLGGSTRTAAGPRATLTVSAAADLTPAFKELGTVFERETGTHVTFNFGSTGQLAQQIASGAPVDLFAAADVAFITGLEQKGLIITATKALYAQGRITIWTRADRPLKLARIQDLARADIKNVAIANPEHAPYGTAAREALQSAGVWSTVQPKLVFGENVAQTLTLADTGNVDAAIVALSVSVQSKGTWVLIPENLHKPLKQMLAVIKGSTHEATARTFARFINGPIGRPIMQKYGFTLPGEVPVP